METGTGTGTKTEVGIEGEAEGEVLHIDRSESRAIQGRGGVDRMSLVSFVLVSCVLVSCGLVSWTMLLVSWRNTPKRANSGAERCRTFP